MDRMLIGLSSTLATVRQAEPWTALSLAVAIVLFAAAAAGLVLLAVRVIGRR